MKLFAIADFLWGDKARVSYLLVATMFLLFAFLGEREIWTQEHRWAEIVSGMFYRNDFLHPYLGNTGYYDKPLLSYWLIVIFSKLNNALTAWTLRLPSAISGLLSIWFTYRLGVKIKSKQFGLLSGWLLLTTYYFVFWSRTSNTDMLNLAGSLFAVSWYFDKRDHATFFDYTIFFIILAVTSLCKGLIGAIVPLIAVCVDLTLRQSWKQQIRVTLFLSMIPALLVYLLPFLVSSYFSADTFQQNGLYLVYRENILRYFQPFDHQNPIYVYFYYLPIYLMPWAIFFFPALFSIKSRWKGMSIESKWIAWTLMALFLFFTMSGSRRNYYALPMVPFAVLFIADWILSETTMVAKKRIWLTSVVVLSFGLLFMVLDLIPAWYYSQYGVNRFTTLLRDEVSKIKPWDQWNVVLLDAESKMNFYLQLPPSAIKYHIKGTERNDLPTVAQIMAEWPLLKNKPRNAIFVSRKLYVPILQNMLRDYRMFEIQYPRTQLVKINEMDVPVAYIPVAFQF
ncbi:MAG: glycosyltransferase family 39 protein [Gammaproteobacteria bacterium]|nr:glycosyltransferase family 39 protein [Gammaproteobacteria bacterium]MCW5583011.1 glycosyltransferase family 39 protein [Gammaproteobacteria bacterium]